eukprot:tig00000821_g4474.t1
MDRWAFDQHQRAGYAQLTLGEQAPEPRRVPRLVNRISIEKTESVICFLEGMGLEKQEIFKMAIKFPYLLDCDVKSMEGICDVLRMGGVVEDDLIVPIRRSPFLFKYRPEKLRETAEYILKLELPEAVVELLFRRQPETLGMLPETLAGKIQFFRDLLSWEELVELLGEVPTLLGMNLEHGFMPKIDWLRSLGLDKESVTKIITQSTFLKLNLEYNIKPKYKYLTQELQRPGPESICKMPTFFQRSLVRRILPRGEYCRLHGPPDLSLSAMLSSTDAQFAARVMGGDAEGYREWERSLDARGILQRFCTAEEVEAVLRLAKEGSSVAPTLGPARLRAQSILAASRTPAPAPASQ